MSIQKEEKSGRLIEKLMGILVENYLL